MTYHYPTHSVSFQGFPRLTLTSIISSKQSELFENTLYNNLNYYLPPNSKTILNYFQYLIVSHLQYVSFLELPRHFDEKCHAYLKKVETLLTYIWASDIQLKVLNKVSLDVKKTVNNYVPCQTKPRSLYTETTELNINKKQKSKHII